MHDVVKVRKIGATLVLGVSKRIAETAKIEVGTYLIVTLTDDGKLVYEKD